VKGPAAWIVALALLAIAGGGAYAWGSWSAAGWVSLSRVSGWVAALLLLASLATSPFGPGAPKTVKRWRRAFGVGAAVASLAHLGLGLAGPLRDSLDAIWTWPTYRAGALAALILTALLVTSFSRTKRVKVWKPLHRLVYVAGALVLLHLLRLPFASLVGVLFFGSALVVLLGWRVGKWLGARGARPKLR